LRPPTRAQGKGYFSGKAHTFTAKIGPSVSGASSAATYVIEGQWNGKSAFTKDSKKRAGQPFVDAGPDAGRDEIAVAPISEQGEMESRRIWTEVADGIRKGNFEASTAAKVKLEVRAVGSHPRRRLVIETERAKAEAKGRGGFGRGMEDEAL
jgi:hypothetical protein